MNVSYIYIQISLSKVLPLFVILPLWTPLQMKAAERGVGRHFSSHPLPQLWELPSVLTAAFFFFADNTIPLLYKKTFSSLMSKNWYYDLLNTNTMNKQLTREARQTSYDPCPPKSLMSFLKYVKAIPTHLLDAWMYKFEAGIGHLNSQNDQHRKPEKNQKSKQFPQKS